MKVGVLFSGGKDSNYCLYQISKEHEVCCLISMISKNKESYMFQTPGNDFISFQAEAMNIPLIKYNTKGIKEKELDDLKDAIKKAMKEYNIDCIASGAIKSVYQATRIQKICDELNLWCVNPLWQKNETKFMEDLIKENFLIKIIGVFSYPLNKNYIGKTYDLNMLEKMKILNQKYGVSVAGEGGEIETFVCNSPLFKKEIKIKDYDIIMDSENSGIMDIKKIELK